MATGQCDRWKNVAKTSVVTSMITVDKVVSAFVSTFWLVNSRQFFEAYLVNTHDMTGWPKNGDELLAIVKSDIQLILEKFATTVIAWCTDNGPDGKKMCRLLCVKYVWLIVLVCWAHQINLVVRDFLKIKVQYREVIGLVLNIIKWFNNHGQALHLLRTEQKLTYYRQSWALILPVITRWTTHYLSLTRLLKVESALRTCATRHKQALLLCAGACDVGTQATATTVLVTIKDDNFWLSVQK